MRETHYRACSSPINKDGCICAMLDYHDTNCWSRRFTTAGCNCSVSLLLHQDPSTPEGKEPVRRKS